MAEALSRSAQKVQEYLSQFDDSLEVMELAGSTRTAQDAADSIGCSIAQIAKSLVFQDKSSGELVLVIASGINRVDTKKIAQAIGCNLKQAKADLIKEKTGFAIGGIPPVGHAEPLRTVLDEDLKHYETIWAAAGTPFAMVKLSPELLGSLTGGTWLDVRQEK